MSTSNFRIFLSIFLSGIITFFINQYSQNPLLFIKKVQTLPKNIFSSIQNFHFPKINFNLFLSSKKNWQNQVSNQNNQNSLFTLPTSTEKIITPTRISNYQLITYVPTKTYPSQTPITIPTKTLTPTPQTLINTPTKTPKPTKPPKPSPTPKFVLTNPRPGKDIREIAEIVGPIFCVPPAMVYAIYDNEAGYLGQKVSNNWTYYNTYQGSDPTDIPGSTSVFGVTQMMGDTWHRIKPYVAQKLGSTEISLNVTFDAMAAAAFHIRNISLAGKDHIPCDDWPVKYILYGACRYNGACPPNTMDQTQYYNSYTYSVCESYNEYGENQKKCQ